MLPWLSLNQEDSDFSAIERSYVRGDEEYMLRILKEVRSGRDQQFNLES